MERAKTVSRLKNLSKIRGIIEIAKFDTIQKLARTKQRREYHYEMADKAKKIMTFAQSKYKLSNIISKKIKSRISKNTL